MMLGRAFVCAVAADALKAPPGIQIAAAESCTGGLVAGAITAVPGSSQWFERGFVTYSNAAKVDQLGVASATLERFAVSNDSSAEKRNHVLLEANRDMARVRSGVDLEVMFDSVVVQHVVQLARIDLQIVLIADVDRDRAYCRRF